MNARRAGLAFALVLAACGGPRRAAEQAIEAAESALAPIADEAARVAPEQLQGLTTAVADARGALANGDFVAAAEGVKEVPARAAELAGTVEQLKKDFDADFATLSEAMPRNLEAINQKLAKPPRSLSRERLTELRATYDGAVTEWQAVAQEFRGGALASAVGKAFGLKARVSEAMVALGLSSDEKAWGNLITQPK